MVSDGGDGDAGQSHARKRLVGQSAPPQLRKRRKGVSRRDGARKLDRDGGGAATAD